MSFAIGFGFLDMCVIIVRNNMSWTKAILQTRKYQVCTVPVKGCGTHSPVCNRVAILHLDRLARVLVSQILEKFVVGPIGAIWRYYQNLAIDCLC